MKAERILRMTPKKREREKMVKMKRGTGEEEGSDREEGGRGRDGLRHPTESQGRSRIRNREPRAMKSIFVLRLGPLDGQRVSPSCRLDATVLGVSTS